MIALVLLASALACGPEDIPALFREARQAEQRRDLAGALDKYNAVLAADPSIAEVWANKGLVLYELDRHREALRAFQKAVELKPQLANAQLFLGLEFVRFDEPQKALAPLGLALRFDPGSTRVRCALADAHAQLGHHEQAISLYRDVLDREPGMEDARYRLALAYLNLSKSSARKLVDSGSGYGKLLLADYLAITGADESAESNYRAAFEALPDSPEAGDAFRAFFVGRNEPDKARAITKAHSDSRRDGLAPAIALYRERRYEAAFRLLVRSTGDRASYWLSLTCRTLARELLVQSVERNPDSFQTHLLLADVAVQSGDTSAAGAEYEKAARLVPGNAEAQLLYIRFLAASDPEAALHWAQEAARKLPANPELNLELGTLLLKAGDERAAAARFRRALERRPGLGGARAGLASALAAAGAFGEAIVEMERVVSDDPDGSWHYRLATWYRREGRTAESQEAFAATARIKADRRAKEIARFRELTAPQR